jgi:uncharacterized protein YndB with AHSA1/START domain
MKPEIKLEVVYPYPPERVWRAITDPRELEQWLMPNDFQPRLGHKFEFQSKPAPGFDGLVRCEILELDVPRRIVYSWRGGQLDTLVTFTLEPVSHGTRLVLEHRGKGLDGTSDVHMLLTQGWKRMVEEKLPSVLGDAGRNAISDAQRIASLIERYERSTPDLAAILARIPTQDLDRTPAPDAWSARQTAIHIVDAEIIGATRLRMLAAHPGATISGYEGNVWGRAMQYDRQPLEPALELFALLRTVTASMLRLLPPSAWSNRGTHDEIGEITLESCLASHCDHAEAHLQEIEALMRDFAVPA